jgi:ubiquitin carboxyl-terminal hydrolase 10
LDAARLRFVDEFAKPASKELSNQVEQEHFEQNEPFVPQYLFDALKENKRFDTMRVSLYLRVIVCKSAELIDLKGGQQEDAEEFLGFFLDTIEEEMLDLVKSFDTEKAASFKEVAEREEEEQHEADGWIDVGKHNRKVITRAVSSLRPVNYHYIYVGHYQ